MATFPPITPQNLGQTPESSAPGDYDITTQIPVPGAANALKAVLTGSAVGSYTYDNILSGSYGQILADSLVSSGIIDGMELSIGAPATTINIAPGKYVTKNPGAETYSINTFAGVHSEPITLAPQSTAWFVFVNIDAQGTIYFESERGTRTKVCVGGIEVKGTTTASRVYNTGSRIENSGDEFDQFLNDIGVFQRGIVVGLKGNGKIVNTGGIVYAGSVYRGRIVQASSAQTVTTIDDTGTLGQPLTTLTIAALKIYKPVGGADTPLTGSNQFGLWFVFVDLQGNFYLMKPQEEVDPVNNTNITDSDIYQAYEKLVLPEIINTNATLVGCLIVEGNSNDLSDVTVQDLVNKPLSSTEGNKIPGGAPSSPVPVPTLSDEQKRSNPITGSLQLGITGTGDYGFIKGLAGTYALSDGLIYQPPTPYTGYGSKPNLEVMQLQNTATGTITVPPKFYYIVTSPAYDTTNDSANTAPKIRFSPNTASTKNVITNINGLDAVNAFTQFLVNSSSPISSLTNGPPFFKATTNIGSLVASAIGIDIGQFAAGRKVMPFMAIKNPCVDIASNDATTDFLKNILRETANDISCIKNAQGDVQPEYLAEDVARTELSRLTSTFRAAYLWRMYPLIFTASGFEVPDFRLPPTIFGIWDNKGVVHLQNLGQKNFSNAWPLGYLAGESDSFSYPCPFKSFNTTQRISGVALIFVVVSA